MARPSAGIRSSGAPHDQRPHPERGGADQPAEQGRHDPRHHGPPERADRRVARGRQVRHGEREGPEAGPGAEPDEDQGPDPGPEQPGDQHHRRRGAAEPGRLHHEERRGQRGPEERADGGEAPGGRDHRGDVGRYVPPPGRVGRRARRARRRGRSAALPARRPRRARCSRAPRRRSRRARRPAGNPPAWKPSAGDSPPWPGRYRITGATTAPATPSGTSGHHSGGAANPSASGAAVNAQRLERPTVSRRNP